MAELFLGYRHDQAFMRLWTHLLGHTQAPSGWRISWRVETIDLRTGMAKAGQVREGSRSQGITVAMLRSGSAMSAMHMLDARSADSVLIARATPDQASRLSASGRIRDDKGYVLIKDDCVPGLSELRNAVLVTGEFSPVRLAEDLVRSFLLPPVAEVPPPEEIPLVFTPPPTPLEDGLPSYG